MIIRVAVREDAEKILPLVRQLGYSGLDVSGFEEKIMAYESPGNRILLGEMNGKVIAFIALHTFVLFHSPGNVGRITAFCVDENFRSKGIGQQMMAAAENYFLENGCVRMEVTSNNRRVAAHNFYLKLGYTEDSRKFVKYVR
jgi:ribosomal protein S18 acetylase RimI-like enzyme